MRTNNIRDKGIGAINEDVLLMQENTFGVFDGATSLNKYANDEGKTGGLLAAEITRDSFNQPHDKLIDAAKDANSQVREAMIKAEIDVSKGVNLWRSAAAVVRIGKDNFEWLVIADCVVLVIYSDNSFETVVPFQDHGQRVMVKWKKLAEKEEPNIWEKLSSDITALREKSHPPYGVINGEKKMEQLFKHGSYSLADVQNIVIFTDGLLVPDEDPTKPQDFQQFVNIFQSDGLEGILKAIRNLERDDPNCWKYPRYKQHDDIAAIALRF